MFPNNHFRSFQGHSGPLESSPETTPRPGKRKLSRYLRNKLGKKSKKGDSEIGNNEIHADYELIPTEDTGDKISSPDNYSQFIPQKQSSFIGANETIEDSKEPLSMESELKRLQQ